MEGRDDGFPVGGACGSGAALLPPGEARGPARSPQCARCAAPPAVALRGEAALCSACGADVLHARLRRALTAPPARGAHVLLCCSAGAASRAAADVACHVMHCGRKRRFWASASALHVDLSAAAASAALHRRRRGSVDSARASSAYAGDPVSGDASATASLALRACLQAGLHTYVVPLETALLPGLLVVAVRAPEIVDAVGDHSSRSSRFCVVPEAEAERLAASACGLLQLARAPAALSPLAEAAALLHGVLAACPDSDACQEAIEAMVRKLLVRVAAALGTGVLISCETADRMAGRVLLSACGGNGFSLAADTGLVDMRFVEASGVPGEAARPEPRELALAMSPALAPATATEAMDGGLFALRLLRRLPCNWYVAELETSSPPAIGTPLQAPLPQPLPPLIYRPFIEVEQSEVALYVRLRRLRPAAAAAALCFTARATPRSSVAFAVQGLLAGLQATFPATVHNVVRTARKLRAPSAAVCTDDVGLCAFCFALLPPRAVVTALAAAAVSDAGGDAVELCTRCLRLARVLPSLVAP